MIKKWILFVLFISLPGYFCQKNATPTNIFYVATDGNDSWSGKLAEPNRERSDGPFATLQRAREAARRLQQSQVQSDESIVINIRGGRYPISASLLLDQQDSGRESCPIIWRACQQEKVVLHGAKRISDFKPVTDPSLLRRFDPNCRDKILVCDLMQQGITNLGEITRRGGPGLELFFNGRRMTIARYPNSGWLKIADVPQYGERLFRKGLQREKRYHGVPVGRHYGRIKYREDRPRRWSGANDIYLHGYWTWDWSDSYQRVKSIDTTKHEITLAEPHHHYGYTTNQRYYFLNVLEELDRPGEWVLDRNRGRLYFFPPSDIAGAEVYVSLLEAPFIRLDQCRNVTIQGLTFEFSRGNGIVVNGGSNNLIAACTFRCLGSDAVQINGGTNNGITGCDIFDVAAGGIILKGGSQKTLTPGNNFATNNHIYDYSQWVRTGQLAINLYGVGNRIAHNLIHDAPHIAIYVRGNEHVIEFNEIYNVCYETGDAGAIYSGRNYAWRGNVYRYNYIHHLKGPGLHGCTALYLDDFTSGYILYGNICYQSGRGVLIGGGRDNVVENNIFVRCFPSIVLDARGLGWASKYFDGSYPVLRDSLEAMNFQQPPYSQRYPELLHLYDDDPAVPKNNRIVRNVSFGGRWIDLYDFFAYDFSVVTMKDNVIADSIVCKRTRQRPDGWDPYYLNLDTDTGYVYFRYDEQRTRDEFPGNLIIGSDPGFVDREHEDFRLKKDSPAFGVGFQKIPVEKIGLYVDEYRKVADFDRE